MTQPFARRLQCLRCGRQWWSQTEAPSWCPECKPVRGEANGTTTYPIAAEVDLDVRPREDDAM